MTSDDLFGDDDDLFSVFAETEPKSTEETFCNRILSTTKKDQLCSWLGYQVSIYNFMSEDEGVKYTRTVTTDQGVSQVEVRRLAMCKKLLKYYLLTFHLATFQQAYGKGDNVPTLDIDKCIDTIVNDDKVKSAINRDY